MRANHSAARAHPCALGPRPPGRVVDDCLAAVPEAPAAARAAGVDALTGQVDGRALADAELLVSELVTNSVRHAGPAAGELAGVGAAVSRGVARLEPTPGLFRTTVAPAPGWSSPVGLRRARVTREVEFRSVRR